MLENINLAFQGVWSHKLRSFLTMLGIIIGIAAIITIVSTIQGTNEQIKENLIGAGNNVVRVQLTQDGNQVELGYMALPQGVSVITEEMRDEMSKLDSVADVALYHQRQWPDGVYVGNNSFSGNLYGIDSHYLAAADYAVNYGRGFSASDFAACRKVALIDTKTAQSLFQGENPIGGTMEISGEPFTVVGVISPRVTSEPVINNLNDYYMYTGNTSGTVFIPDSCWPIVYRYDEPQSVAVRATSTNDMTTAGNNVAEYLNGHVISGDTFKYQSKDLLEQASQLQSLSESSNKQLIWIAAMVIFGVVEAITVGLTSIWFVVGSVAGLIAAICGGPIWLQLALFFVVSIVCLAATRPLVKKLLHKDVTATNADRVLGQTARVTENIDNAVPTGAVYVGGMTWTARSESGQPIPRNAQVKIVRMEGVRLFVEPV